MLETIVDTLLDENGCAQLSITLRTRSGLTRRQRDGPGDVNATPPSKSQEFTYPGTTVHDAWRFSTQSNELHKIQLM